MELIKPRPPMPPPEDTEKLAVTQKSDDPDVERPEDARFVAEENRRVEEETVAENEHVKVLPGWTVWGSVHVVLSCALAVPASVLTSVRSP